MTGSQLRVGVVGPCGAGKSTLVAQLKDRHNIRAISQEHSYVPDMWRRVRPTDVLIYLDANIKTIAKRRKISWGQQRLDALNYRLRHAHAHADFYLPTDTLSIEEVAQRISEFLEGLEAK